MSAQPQSQTLSFQAEVNQLLHIVTHSLYSNKEIFLRELISNASDANDKLRYAALSDAALYEKDSDLKIKIDVDEKNRIITVTDNGIGMSREEVIENIGTIAKSGTRAFRELLGSDKAKDSQLIGQFGVGFYSAFIVAEKVVVKTRRAGMNNDQGVWWESNGEGQYTIKNINKDTRGTEIILYLKKDEEEFLNAQRIRGVIRKYSDHILFPIVMKKYEPSVDKEKPAPLTTKDGAVIEKDKPQTVTEEVVNSANALWTLPKDQIKDEEYKQLYKHISHDFEDPLAWTHNRVEGSHEYINLLYIPARAPFDLFQRDMQRGIKLYIKRVFIMDEAEQLMPLYLRFIKGIVDSSDLPLNISREILQSNRTVEKIRSGSVKRVLDLLEKLANDEKEKYTKFWKEFGAVLKEGPAEDFANKDRIAKLLRFSSTAKNNEIQDVSLDEYLSRMKPEQDKIYYLIADNFNAAKNSPLLEVFRKKDIEVLLMSDRVDEWLMGHLTEYSGKQFQSLSQGNLDLGKLENPEEKQEKEKKETELSDVVQKVKEALGARVKEVRLTHRLTESPSCVVFDDAGMSGHMQRLLKAAGQAMLEAPPILELNPDHAIIARVKNESDKQKVQRWSEILLGQALLAEGEQLKDPASFVKDLNALLLE